MNASYDAKDWNNLPRIVLYDEECPNGNGFLRLQVENLCLMNRKKQKEIYYRKVKKKKQKISFLLIDREKGLEVSNVKMSALGSWTLEESDTVMEQEQ
jgi:hypothetical protein